MQNTNTIILPLPVRVITSLLIIAFALMISYAVASRQVYAAACYAQPQSAILLRVKTV